MGVLQAKGGLAHVFAGSGDGQGAVALDDLAQVGAVLDIFHDQEKSAGDFIGVEGADDVGMIELSGGADFPLETLDRLRVDGAVLADDLDGDDAAQAALPGLVHRAHAAFPQAVEEDIGAQGQVLPPPLQQEIGLKGGQPAALDQVAGQRLGVGKKRLQPGRLGQLLRFQQLAGAKSIDQVGHRDHDASTSAAENKRIIPARGLPVNRLAD